MGGGASTHNHIAHKLMPPMEEEAQKPADASDLPDDAEILKKEVIALRGKLRHAVDHGRQHLDTENQKAMQEAVNGLMKNAVEVEKSITPFLKDVVKKCGGELTGLNHRFKTRDSLERKVMGDIEAMKRRNARSKSEASSLVDVVGVVNSMGDSLRYTMLVPASEYCAVVISTRKILEEMGNPGIKFKNYWEKGKLTLSMQCRNDRS